MTKISLAQKIKKAQANSTIIKQQDFRISHKKNQA